MQPIEEPGRQVWRPEPEQHQSVWEQSPAYSNLSRVRPQEYIVEPPIDIELHESVSTIAFVREIQLIEPTGFSGESLLVYPPEREYGTTVEVLKEIRLILTDLTAGEIKTLAAEGYRVSRNEVRYIPPIQAEALSERIAQGQVAWTDSAALTWGLQAIGAGETNCTGQGIKVAVLDTGCSPFHPDFEGRIREENVMSFVTGETAVDRHGHGTHVCGTVAGPFKPQIGARYAVAPASTLLVGKVLSNSGSGYDSWILKGINWAAKMRAEIVNLSLGSRRANDEEHSFEYEALAARLLGLDRPVLIVGAAGNDSARPNRLAPVNNPAACPSIIACSAVGPSGEVAPFACAGTDDYPLDLSGPGVAVLSAALGGGVAELDGTSMAAPHVSGIAALWAEADGTLRGKSLRDALVSNVLPLNGDEKDVGRGLVQAPRHPKP